VCVCVCVCVCLLCVRVCVCVCLFVDVEYCILCILVERIITRKKVEQEKKPERKIYVSFLQATGVAAAAV
jgi:hypothetical protein